MNFNTNIVDYSKLLKNAVFLPGYQELFNPRLSLPENFYYLLKRVIILPHDWYDLITAYAFIPSALAKIVPYLFLYGGSGSGKTTLAKVISYLHGVTRNSSLAFSVASPTCIDCSRSATIAVLPRLS
jgi:polynucleotide 5'-kinase involved in rRNA processing